MTKFIYLFGIHTLTFTRHTLQAMTMVASAAVRRVFVAPSARLALFDRFDLRIVVEGNATVYLNGVVVSPAVAPATARYFNAIVANVTLLNGTNVCKQLLGDSSWSVIFFFF